MHLDTRFVSVIYIYIFISYFSTQGEKYIQIEIQ